MYAFVQPLRDNLQAVLATASSTKPRNYVVYDINTAKLNFHTAGKGMSDYSASDNATSNPHECRKIHLVD